MFVAVRALPEFDIIQMFWVKNRLKCSESDWFLSYFPTERAYVCVFTKSSAVSLPVSHWALVSGFSALKFHPGRIDVESFQSRIARPLLTTDD